MATSFPYLLDSILALSALHLATVEPDNRLTWLDAAVRYQSQACSGMGKILPDVTRQHYEPAFVSSVLIFLFATGLPGISPETNQSNDPLSEVLEGRRLITGSAMLFERFSEMGVDAELNGWLCAPDTEENLEKNEQNRYLTSRKFRSSKILTLYGVIAPRMTTRKFYLICTSKVYRPIL
jgi:gamma-glutamyltranspeptidase/glutathione hydrolase